MRNAGLRSARPPRPATSLLDRLRAATRGEFRIIREIGKGGMAHVFLAREVSLARHVALKVLSPLYGDHPEIARRFEQEARTAAGLSHPNIVPVFAVYHRDGVTFFSMPHVAGMTFRDVLVRHAPFDVEGVADYIEQAAAGLDHAHSRGVVHRDIKPENMLVEEFNGRLMLTDFGLAKALGARALTLPGEMIGTPHYMAPEQCGNGQSVDGRSDQYALALIAYEMLLGRYPFTADDLRGLIVKQVTEVLPPVSELRRDVPRRVSNAIRKALAKDPDGRFPSVLEFARAMSGRQARRSIESIEPGGSGGAAPDRDGFQVATIRMRSKIMRRHRLRRVRGWLHRALAAAALCAVVYAGGRLTADRSSESSLRFGEVEPATAFMTMIPTGPALSRADSAPDDEVGDAWDPAGPAGPGSPARSAASTEGRPEVSEPVAGARSSDLSVEGLLERYRRALEGEDLEALDSSVYADGMPDEDRKKLAYIFDAVEDLRVTLAPGALDAEGDNAHLKVGHELRYRLRQTGRAEDWTMEFGLRLVRTDGGWRLAGIDFQ